MDLSGIGALRLTVHAPTQNLVAHGAFGFGSAIRLGDGLGECLYGTHLLLKGASALFDPATDRVKNMDLSGIEPLASSMPLRRSTS